MKLRQFTHAHLEEIGAYLEAHLEAHLDELVLPASKSSYRHVKVVKPAK